jgi:hypothetical protein
LIPTLSEPDPEWTGAALSPANPLSKTQRSNYWRADLLFIVEPQYLEVRVVEEEADISCALSRMNPLDPRLKTEADQLCCIVFISLGGTHGCGIRNERAWCWGSNAFGALGDGTRTDRGHPVQVSVDEAAVTDVVAGRNHTLVLV